MTTDGLSVRGTADMPLTSCNVAGCHCGTSTAPLHNRFVVNNQTDPVERDWSWVDRVFGSVEGAPDLDVVTLVDGNDPSGLDPEILRAAVFAAAFSAQDDVTEQWISFEEVAERIDREYARLSAVEVTP